jgi:hypothetical protein
MEDDASDPQMAMIAADEAEKICVDLRNLRNQAE